jgi:DNA damage-inducible protein 1
LKKNVLHIGTTGSETRFLSESELPASAKGATSPSSENQKMETLNRTVQSEEDHQLAEALAQSEAAMARQADSFKEEDVKKLMDLGFTRDQVIEELRIQGGNVNKATVSLVGKAFGSNIP